ncbi:CPBP family intramembrane metalloprotease [Bacillus sp. BRMEA1]|uniref:CPBP family intramembrane glutamic endopeptidase n=1 Tax=Neobacillus endophyticus TaxID=2738405 RepID=UPI001566942C|nr:type II CAAX endopeptidase family protein [Neobacillus endophyticus]NRD77633.1 CPBP family intramembrane metalloprotease [Neobacillus endophyticus]
MKKEYWIILIVYIAMQFSSLIGIPVLIKGFHLQGKLAIPVWLIISFSSALIIVLIILRKEMKGGGSNERSSSFGHSVVWAISGFFLALFAQYFAAIIEHFLGIPSGSENTKEIIDIINTLPSAVIVTSIAGPILEEIVFRKIIFGSLYKRFNFVISALISSLIFALAHMDFMHILIYAAMGFTFAFLYVKTKRIIVPIFAHVSMNTLVVMVQSVYRNDIERLLRDTEKVQNFIGGFFS